MHPYLAHTQEEIKEMLELIGLENIEDLFSDIPSEILFKEKLDFPVGKSELEIRDILYKLASENKSTLEYTSFLGGGAYDHYIPAIIPQLLLRQEFYTAYTPYQPEISQGTLQAIFEYQSMICELTGLQASNASLYDGATAAAEALFMAYEANKRKTFIINDTVNPETKKVIKTYLDFKGLSYIEAKSKDGLLDIDNLKELLDGEIGAVLVQSPNYYGLVEDVEVIADLVHKNKSLLVQSADPISLGLFKTPGEIGADIAVGEGQVLGNTLNFGGPYLGYIACTKKLMRKLPGRIVGKTEDLDGKRGFVLTLQAREQHIRRERATSNITSNQALCALAANIYMAVMGKQGIQDVAKQCVDLSYYTAKALTANNNFKMKYNTPFFREFVIETPIKAADLFEKMLEKKFYAGIDLEPYTGSENELMIAVTEKMTKEKIDCFVKEMEACINE
ncbi:MAG: aminomethyl-transferring glycine dehydrogenase subunit GcvPA [Clostridiales bacterium]|nr:aminomethyl-transferring glycine dehydrogenase subunit GcvPA [Clostridiales bacterium]